MIKLIRNPEEHYQGHLATPQQVAELWKNGLRTEFGGNGALGELGDDISTEEISPQYVPEIIADKLSGIDVPKKYKPYYVLDDSGTDGFTYGCDSIAFLTEPTQEFIDSLPNMLNAISQDECYLAKTEDGNTYMVLWED